jgi:hypothetical protein
MAKRAKKERQKTVSIFLNFAFATAGIIVGAIVGLLIVAAISALLKAVWLVIQEVVKR